MKAIAYIRTSTDDQQNSIGVQEDAIRKYASDNGLDLIQVIRDQGVSGAVNPIDRPELAQALADLRDNKAQALIVYKFDRVARKAWYTLELVDHLLDAGAQVFSVCDQMDLKTGEGLLMLGILACFAQFERYQIRQRTRATMKRKRSRGERVGTVPYGFQVALDGRSLIPRPDEQTVIQEARRYAAMGLSTRVIADTLNSYGYRSRAENVFNKEQVRRMLLSAKRDT